MGNARLACPACHADIQKGCLEVFRRMKLYGCPRCDLQFWHPIEIADPAWHELVYQGRDQRILPLEPGHRFFLSDSNAPRCGRLLDIGCGTGNFLLAARAAGFDVTGLELNPSAARFAQDQLGCDRVLPLHPEEFTRVGPRERFDVVTFFEVLEHQDRPREFLKLAKSCLRQRGYVALSVPNRRRWQKGIEVLDYPPNHLTRWDARALTNNLTAAGFEVLSIRQETLGVRRAAQVLSAGMRTGLVSAVAGAAPATPTDLAELKPDARRATIERDSSLRARIASGLIHAKNFALLPVALALLPYLRFRGHTGAYLYCLARRRD